MYAMNKISSVFVCLVLLVSCQVLNPEEPHALAASFAHNPPEPVASQPVKFTDTSTGSPDKWEWAFGDGSTSTVQNPSHTFSSAGSFTVNLVVSKGSESSNTSQIVAVSPEATGSIYYIDTAHANASDTNPGTEALPWKTITKANQTLVAGDTVYIKGGTYSSYVAPVRSGTASNRITYRAYGADVVTVRDASYGILLDGKSYITVHGINFYNLDRFMYLQNSANYNIIAYCNFDKMRSAVEWAGSRIWRQSCHNWVHHCRFSEYGSCSGTPPNGTAHGVVLEVGDERSQLRTPPTPDYTRYNLIENNVMYHAGHHVLGALGQYNVYRNNYIHGDSCSQNRGSRSLYILGAEVDTGRNLIEGNRIAYTRPSCDDTKKSGSQICAPNNIFRFNCFYFNDLAGLQFSTSGNYPQGVIHNLVYNNTFFYNALNPNQDPGKAAVYLAIWHGSWEIRGNAFKNNLYYGHPKVYGVYQVSLSDQEFANEFNGDTMGNPRFVNATSTPGDPMDADYPDLRLQSNSPCIDAGGPLTTISSPSGSGTVFTVVDAGYFMDGWGIARVQGDLIQIVGTSRRARISNVNYATNTITVDATLTWTRGQGIALAYEGAAPDAGAFEYGSQSTSVKK